MRRTSRPAPWRAMQQESFVTTILAIITHTPIWVWALYALVLFMGYQRARDRTVGVWRLMIFPVVMIVLAVTSMVGGGLGVLPAALVGLAIGGVSGWLMERDGATRRLPDGKLWLRGEWWSFAQIVLILIIRYVIAVTGAVNPALAADSVFHLGATFVASLLSAMILGRTLARLRVYFAATPVAA